MDRVCCCDDKGHAGCVAGSTAVSGEASGVDMTHKEVNRDTAGRRPGERGRTQSANKAHMHILFISALWCIALYYFILCVMFIFSLSGENELHINLKFVLTEEFTQKRGVSPL